MPKVKSKIKLDNFNSKEVHPEIETFAKIKVIGVGGSGGAAINRMMADKIRGVDFMAINTDAQALHHNDARRKLHIGKNITRGLGAGMDPEIGLKSAEEAVDQIRDAIKDTDMVFITCGLGGGTGSGASPLIAEIAKNLGALTVAVVTKPFSFEGAQRKTIADQGLDKLADNVDAIIVIPNDRILQTIDKKTSLLEAFGIVDQVLKSGVKGISEMITVPGLINVDFADVRSIMYDAGSALMGIGEATGENRAIEAAKKSIDSPLLELSIEGARGILFTVSGGQDLGMAEVNEAAKVITNAADPNAKIIFGAVIDEDLKDKVKVTVVATGFGNAPVRGKDQKMDFNPLGETEQPVSTLKKEPITKRRITKDDKVIDRKKDILEKTEEEELEIPAFIRKKMM
ncbi:cell division protein FtsZ [Candidatus Parcubacteria bacterium]|nr:cell division protein FtsZ [Patescibacteria group bacterium]MBU4481954.1 cell division protein FtsZ [Patescibacteria group bacterium]MCG2687048.1 cell division protein FtsZ [Candidatus Parcubacteria bacterium]